MFNTENTPATHAEAPQQIERLVYTKTELTKALGLSSITIYRLEQRGLLHPVQGVRHKLFTIAEVNRFLAQREEP